MSFSSDVDTNKRIVNIIDDKSDCSENQFFENKSSICLGKN
jgi:hypothetical protein